MRVRKIRGGKHHGKGDGKFILIPMVIVCVFGCEQLVLTMLFMTCIIGTKYNEWCKRAGVECDDNADSKLSEASLCKNRRRRHRRMMYASINHCFGLIRNSETIIESS